MTTTLSIQETQDPEAFKAEIAAEAAFEAQEQGLSPAAIEEVVNFFLAHSSL